MDISEKQLQMNWPIVDKFAKSMKRELNANRHKVHWGFLQPEYLVRELEEHLEKLKEAIDRDNAHDVLEFSADVANLSMMVADITVGI